MEELNASASRQVDQLQEQHDYYDKRSKHRHKGRWFLSGAYILACLLYLDATCFCDLGNWVKVGAVTLALIGIIYTVPYAMLVGRKVSDWYPNESLQHIILQLRLRGLQAKNLAALCLVLAIVVLIGGFAALVLVPANVLGDKAWVVRVSGMGLLVLLVNVVFCAFKYLVRIGGFYHGIADALELRTIQPELDFEKMLDKLAPGAYDISDIEGSSLLTAIKDMVGRTTGK